MKQKEAEFKLEDCEYIYQVEKDVLEVHYRQLAPSESNLLLVYSLRNARISVYSVKHQQ